MFTEKIETITPVTKKKYILWFEQKINDEIVKNIKKELNQYDMECAIIKVVVKPFLFELEQN